MTQVLISHLPASRQSVLICFAACSSFQKISSNQKGRQHCHSDSLLRISRQKLQRFAHQSPEHECRWRSLSPKIIW